MKEITDHERYMVLNGHLKPILDGIRFGSREEAEKMLTEAKEELEHAVVVSVHEYLNPLPGFYD